MAREQIQPEKVTRPFQLLAAWLVTLIALDAAFLTAARLITEPAWVPGLLSITAVINVPVFLISMFLLQTRFRPEMQDDKYYATYLKERRETAQVAVKLTERMAASGLDIQSLVTAQRKLSDLPHAIESEIKSLLTDLRSHVAAQQQPTFKLSEPDPSSILALAKGLLAEQDWPEAATEFARYARYHPEDWEASYARGVAYANSRGGESSDLASLRAYNDAIAYAPLQDGDAFRARLFAYRGAMLKRLNRLEEAEADLNVAQRHTSAEYERMDVAYNLACVYALQKRREDMLTQIRIIKPSRRYLGAVQAHLTDYFANYRNDRELLDLIKAA
jgi:tetratricopeptide (TPR) repeat protein